MPFVASKAPRGLAHLHAELLGVTEVLDLAGRRLAPRDVHAWNPAFDVTPARLVTGLITERGVCAATPSGLLSLFPEHRAAGE